MSAPGSSAGEDQSVTPRPALLHRLNNQLGIALANAELLEAKATDQVDRARAAQVVASVLAALGSVRELRQRTEPADPPRGAGRHTMAPKANAD